MLMSREDCRTYYRCPVSGQPLIQLNSNSLVTESGIDVKIHQYSVIDNIPILVNFEESVLDQNQTVVSAGKSVIHRPMRQGFLGLLRRFISAPSKVTVVNVGEFIRHLKKKNSRPRVLVIGGGEHWGGNATAL
jgi:hypothetical protein